MEKVQTRNEREDGVLSQMRLDELQNFQRQSYELTQRLTYFVISIELVFCGYLLLNASTLGEIEYADYLFAVSGLAAFFGLIWRVIYNEGFHRAAHDSKNLNGTIRWIGEKSYWVFVVLSTVTFIVAIVVGFDYLHTLPHH